MHKIVLLCLFLGFTGAVLAQQKDNPAGSPSPTYGPSMLPEDHGDTDSVLVTIILKHQQDKTLAEIRRKLEAQGFWDLFPPADCRVVRLDHSHGIWPYYYNYGACKSGAQAEPFP
ncbi:MAG: hypothetical protein IPL65_18700 [Lewinellaceae bacterium]|nr:hypothetical protein [Lewinellaceae bacterium]